jgi:hypothetical protein
VVDRPDLRITSDPASLKALLQPFGKQLARQGRLPVFQRPTTFSKID